ncbi:MAG: FliH/SctL family protein [Ignavibacteriales bacterium]|nr:FliH/SctL family protein [Ignavibacteriales bacterium]
MSNVIKLTRRPQNLKTEIGDEFFFEAKKEIEIQLAQKQETQLRYEKAFLEGYESAKQELQNEIDNQVMQKAEEFYRILASFEDKLSAYDSSLPEVISKVSVMIAEKIVSTGLEGKSNIEATIKKAVQKIIGASEILIKLNPKDYEMLNANNNLNSLDNSNAKVKFEVTEKIAIGGCLIESEIGNVDARISSQLEEMTRAFQGNFSNVNSDM